MRRTLLVIGFVAIVLAGAIGVSWAVNGVRIATRLPMVAAASALFESEAMLPAVFKPFPTPTPTITPTAVPTNTPEPTLTPEPTTTPLPPSTPDPGNAIVNGSFEQGWTNLPPAPGFLINQEPKGWRLTWLGVGEPIWDDGSATAQGVPECLHKLEAGLPPDEWAGGPRPLILEGKATYKTFHFAAPFGTELYQSVGGLPPGTTWRLTVPIQLHTHGDNDPWAAESGVWATTSADQAGGWVSGGTMGDHHWFFHKVEITVPADGRIEVYIRVKSKWNRGKDFFIDDVRLVQIGTQQSTSLETAKAGIELAGQNGRLWLPRPLEAIPARELISDN